MKKLSFNLILIAISAILMVSIHSCSKQRLQEEEEEEPELSEYSSPDSFYDANKPQEQEYEITQDGPGPLVGQKGTKIWLGKDLLMHQNGDSVQYPFTIKLIELYTPQDMILYNMPTIAGGDILVTDGEIRVRAFKDGEELKLRPGRVWWSGVPCADPQAQMDVFYGIEGAEFVDWTDDASVVDPTVSDSLTSIDIDSTGYFLNLPYLGWINCDYFYNSSEQKTTITFSSETDVLTNVDKFIYFSGIKSLMQVYGNVSGEIPIGTSATIICIGIGSDSKLHYYSKEISVADNQVVNVTMVETTEDSLMSFLAGL